LGPLPAVPGHGDEERRPRDNGGAQDQMTPAGPRGLRRHRAQALAQSVDDGCLRLAPDNGHRGLPRDGLRQVSGRVQWRASAGNDPLPPQPQKQQALVHGFCLGAAAGWFLLLLTMGGYPWWITFLKSALIVFICVLVQ